VHRARDHGISGVGIDMSQLFSEQATLRASELGVTEHVRFIHADATGYIAEEKFDIAACIGATWIAGGVAGTVKQLEQSLKSGGILLIGEPYWRQIPATEEIAKSCGATSVTDFLCQNAFRLSTSSVMTWSKWYWRTRRVGTDTRRQNG
jgi:SAM-dependent methyltransferase